MSSWGVGRRPRGGDLGEYRNEHELSTARWLRARDLVNVAADERALIDRLDRIDVDDVSDCPSIGSFTDPMLINCLGQFLKHEASRAARQLTPDRKRIVTSTQRADGQSSHTIR